MTENTPIVAAGGLIFASDATCLLMKAPKWSNLWGIPGGKVHYGETLLEGFIRETREETGLEVANPQHLLLQESIFPNQYHEKRHFIFHTFFADLAKGFTKEDVKLNHEATDFQWVNPDAALEIALTFEVRKIIEQYLQRHETKIRFFMVISEPLGSLPEEESAKQELLIDFEAIPKSNEKLSHYEIKELIHTIAAKGFESVENFAEKLSKILKDKLPVNSLSLTIGKPHSTIGISTYVTVKR